MFQVNNIYTRTLCEICSKLTIKTPERRHWRRPDVFIVSFGHILPSCCIVFINYFEKVIVCWEIIVQLLIYDGLVISISFPHYLPWCSGSRHLLAQSRSRSSRTKYQICVKLTVIEQRQLVVLVCFLLTFSRFQTLCWRFYSWLWTCNCRPGMYGMWNSKPLDLAIYSLFRNSF